MPLIGSRIWCTSKMFLVSNGTASSPQYRRRPRPRPSDQVLCTFDAEAGFAGAKALVVLADQADQPVERYDVALTVSTPCFLATSSISLVLKAVPSLTTRAEWAAVRAARHASPSAGLFRCQVSSVRWDRRSRAACCCLIDVLDTDMAETMAGCRRRPSPR